MSHSSLVRSPSGSAFATLSGVAARTPDGSTLFEDLTLAFGAERTGVVGRNGVGKTTLLRIVAGLDRPDEGFVTLNARVGWLDQQSHPITGQTVSDTLGVSSALELIDRILAGNASAGDLDNVDWTFPARIETALADVGLAGLYLDRETTTLSGGEQTRLRLAALLLTEPDLLVLDEPTNHLDREGRDAVVRLLDRWKGGAVVVSHDRALLRRMDRIVEVTGLGVEIFGGNYDLHAERRAAERAAAERGLDIAEREAATVRREAQRAAEKKARRDKAGRAFAARASEPKILLGAMAERAENSTGRERRLAERQITDAKEAVAQARERVERVRVLAIPMPETGLPESRTVVALDDASVRIGTTVILAPMSLRLCGPERVAITGPNGAGKSTLLKLIAGEIEPSEGRADRSVVSALLDQQSAILHSAETLIDAYRRINPGATVNEAQAALARFLFRNAAAGRVIGTLSGGERLRAALACVMTGTRPPQLLLLDEPTNHLDLDSIEAVEAAIRAYDGALIVVSHDADFLEAIGVTRRVELRPGG